MENYITLAQLDISPIVSIVIYVTVFIMVSIVLWGVDYTKFIKRENTTQFIAVALYLITTLCVTFLIGSLFILTGTFISSIK